MLNRKKPFKVLLAATATATMALTANGAAAQTTTGRQPGQPGGIADTQASDDVVVYGARAENNEIVQEKRNTVGVADFFGADEAGKLPDFNVAETLRRIPGVTSLFDEDRGRFVVVRGLAPGLNYVAIDGLSVATIDDFGGTGRKVNLQVIPPTGISLLEVRKTFTPDVQGGAIGGYVNLHTLSAFDRQKATFYVEGGPNLQTYKDVPDVNNGRGPLNSPFGGQVDATYAGRFGSDRQFGLVLSGHFEQDSRDESKDVQAGEAYYNSAGRSVSPLLADGTVNPAWNGFVAPTEVRSFDYTNRVTDFGGNGKLEYQQGNIKAAVFGYYFGEHQQETRKTVAAYSLANPRNQTAESGDLTYGEIRTGWNFNPLHSQNFGVNGFVTVASDDRSKLDIRGGWSFADFWDFQPLIDFRAIPTNRAVTYNVVSSDPRTNRYTFADTAAILNPANYTLLTYNETTRYSKENDYNARLDYIYTADKSGGFGFGSGGEYRRLDRVRDNGRTDYVVNGTKLTNFAQQTSFQPSWVNFPLLYVDGSSFVANAVPNLQVNASSTAQQAVISDYEYIEDSIAAYALGSYTAPGLSLIAGGRYEYVRTTAVAPGNNLAAPFLTNKGDYRQFLPSAVASYEVARGLVLKGAFSKSLGRPDPGDVAQRELRNDVSLTISRGNPDLRPRISTNYDVSLEYYFPNGGGLLSVAGFIKDIKNEIYTQSQVETVDGLNYQVTEPRNAQGSHVAGVEAGLIVRRFAFLPKPLDGFGLNANMTYVDGSISYVDASGAFARFPQLPYQSKWSGNASLFYSIPNRFEIRATYNYQGSYYEAIATNPWQATGWAPFNTVDLSLRYDFTPQLSVRAKARNLLNENRKHIRGIGLDDLHEDVEFGQSFFLTAAFRL